MSRLKSYVGSLALLLGVWELAAYFLSSVSIPRFSTVGQILASEIINGSFTPHVAASSLRVVYSVSLALSLAVPIGILMGSETRIDQWLSPFIYLLYPIPHIVLLPVVILFFGIEELPKVVMITMILFFQVVVASRDAAYTVNPYYVMSILSLGATRWDIYWHVILPASLPRVLTALRIGIGTAVAVLFFVESFATSTGLGYLILDNWIAQQYGKMYASMFAMGLLGFFAYTLVDNLEKHLCRWIHL